MTSAEASSIAGVTFAAGKEDTTSGGAKTCGYGAKTPNVFMVIVAQAPDAATAQADWTQEQAKAQASNRVESLLGNSSRHEHFRLKLGEWIDAVR